MISETTNSSFTKLIGVNLHVGEHEKGYSNLSQGMLKTASTPPRGARRGLRKLDGQTGFQKNCKTPFFSRYSNFLLMGDWNWSKNYPVFFFLKNLNKYGR